MIGRARLALLLLLFFVASCDRARERLAGKWQAANDPNAMVWEFSANGALKAGETAGRYTLGDGRRIKIQTPRATFVYELELRDDVMIWKEASGARTELHRLR